MRVSVRLFDVVLCLVVVLVVASNGQQQNLRPGAQCTTPTQEEGTCVGLRQCPELLAMQLKPRPIPAADQLYLQQSQCGQQKRLPLVCCNSKTTTLTTTSSKTKATQRPETATMGDESTTDVSRHRNLALINSQVCGRGDFDRIFNGNKTGVFEYPWMTLIYYATGQNEGRFRCGGTIINENYILTAAHCIGKKRSLKPVSVRVGEHDTSKLRDCELASAGGAEVCADPPQDIAVAEAIRHPQFSEATSANDVALLRLASPIRINRNSVQPICLPVGPAEQDKQHARPENRKKLIVAGWGRTETGLPASPDLLKVFVPYVPTAACAAVYEPLRKEVDHRQICAGGETNGQDSCGGDSGGPLMGYAQLGGDPAPRYLQYGIVSFGPKKCGTANVPGVYTRVGWYMSWILDNIRP